MLINVCCPVRISDSFHLCKKTSFVVANAGTGSLGGAQPLIGSLKQLICDVWVTDEGTVEAKKTKKDHSQIRKKKYCTIIFCWYIGPI